MLNFSDPTATLRLSRRKFLAGAAGLIAAGVLPKSALALAGPHTFKHGAFELTVVSDGIFNLPVKIINSTAKPQEIRALLGLAADAETHAIDVSPMVIRAGSDIILIDAGTGPGMGPATGHTVEGLKLAGIEAPAVTKVIYTHAHPDHLWGTLAADSAMVFPNATYHISEAEWNFWTMPDLVSMMPKDMEGMVKLTQGQLAAIKDKITPFKPGAEVVAGINVIDTNGHTPGHASFELAGGDGLIVSGDVVPVPKVFFANPDWAFGFDADGAAAAKSRRMLLDMASAGKKTIIGYHWPYPGLGMAEKKDNAYVFVPV